MVNVILLERVEKLGQMGQVVKVRPGYARNYLLPQKKALRATKENLTYFEKQRVQLEAGNLQRRSEAEQVAQKLNGLFVVVIRQAGESGQLYGSVSARDIADAVTRDVVDELLILNFGRKARGAVAIEPAPIETDSLGVLRGVLNSLIAKDGAEAAGKIDVAGLLDQLSVPRVG